MKDRFGQACDFNLVIRHPLDSHFRALGQHRRSVPDIENKDAAGLQVPSGRFKCRCYVFIGGLVADDVKQGNDSIKCLV
jgi:hypothetical protein